MGHGQSCLGKDFLSHSLLTAKSYKIREEIYDFLSFGHMKKKIASLTGKWFEVSLELLPRDYDWVTPGRQSRLCLGSNSEF